MTEPDKTSLVTHEGFMHELQRSCNEKRTGTLLIATKDNHLARIYLENGVITFVSYGLKKGVEAIIPIKEITQARVKFSQKQIGGHHGEKLPSTAEILHLLAGEQRVPTTTARLTPNSITGDQMPGVLKVIESELVEFLGPLAVIVWSEQLERYGKPSNPSQLQALIDNLAMEIGDPSKVKRFRQQIWQKIGAGQH
jgi:hypothetical protein